MRTKWLGVLEAGVLLGGLAGLVTGFYLLATSPLPGVVTILASMTLLVSSVAKLGAAQETRHESEIDRDPSRRPFGPDFVRASAKQCSEYRMQVKTHDKEL